MEFLSSEDKSKDVTSAGASVGQSKSTSKTQSTKISEETLTLGNTKGIPKKREDGTTTIDYKDSSVDDIIVKSEVENLLREVSIDKETQQDLIPSIIKLNENIKMTEKDEEEIKVNIATDVLKEIEDICPSKKSLDIETVKLYALRSILGLSGFPKNEEELEDIKPIQVISNQDKSLTTKKLSKNNS